MILNITKGGWKLQKKHYVIITVIYYKRGMNYFFFDVDVIFRDIVKITACDLDRKVRYMSVNELMEKSLMVCGSELTKKKTWLNPIA